MRRLLALILALGGSIVAMAQPPLKAAAGQSPTGPYVGLTWTASATPGASYNVYRTLAASCPSALSGYTELAKGVSGTSYSDTSITAGAYCYVATSVVNGAESQPSNAASVSVQPQPPSGLTATAH